MALPELTGRVVLVQFWTYTCINWIRTTPYIRAWARSYREDGLVVIGVHTPEFSFEHDIERVRRALQVRDIDYPVALDNDYQIWRAFGNNYWPALYLFDRDGTRRHHVFGEGEYAETERRLQDLLGVGGRQASVEGSGVEAEADWAHLQTPETYLGYGRGAGPSTPSEVVWDQRVTYGLPSALPVNSWGLHGDWTIEQERVTLDRAGGRLAFSFHSRDVHLVLGSMHGETIPFRVRLDGAPPGSSHGEDVDANGLGRLTDHRLYQLTRAADPVQKRLFEITFDEPGAEAYAFTFG